MMAGGVLVSTYKESDLGAGSVAAENAAEVGEGGAWTRKSRQVMERDRMQIEEAQ